MKMNYKALFAVLFAVLAFAYIPLLISAQADSSTVLSAVTGLSAQISTVEDNMMLRLNAIDQKLAAIQNATGVPVVVNGTQVVHPAIVAQQSSVSPLMPLLYATIGLLVVTIILCVVNIFLAFRGKTRETAQDKREKAEDRREAAQDKRDEKQDKRDEKR
jgi:hypothetical protein